MSKRFCGIAEATRVSSPSSTFEIECLHEDIVGDILDHVILLDDFIRLGAVCKRWYNAFLHKKQHRIEGCNHEVPLLFIPTPFIDGKPHASNFNTNKLVQSTNLLDLFGKKWHNCFSPTIYFPTSHSLCYSYGCLATCIQERNFTNIILNNPITGKIIYVSPVPNTSLFGYYVVLSCNPCICPDKCIVAYLTTRQSYKGFISSIGVIRLGGMTWTQLLIPEGWNTITQILFHNGLLYALGRDYQLVAFHVTGDKCDFQSFHVVRTSKVLEDLSFEYQFLVESVRGDLLMIARVRGLDYEAISMYKLVMNEKMKGDWVGIHRIGNGDEVLFMGDHNVVCVLASKCPNLQPNSAYIFQQNFHREEHYLYDEIRKYRLDTSEMQQGESTEFSVTLKERGGNRSWVPLWINPTLQ